MERRSACHRWRSGLMALLLVAPWPVTGASQRGASPPPAELSALVAQARVEGAIAAWCRGELHAGRSGGFAVALSASRGGGRYVALDADGTVTELAAYAGNPEVSCYSRAEARRLNDTIRQSQTIHGEVATMEHRGHLRLRGGDERGVLAALAGQQGLREGGRLGDVAPAHRYDLKDPAALAPGIDRDINNLDAGVTTRTSKGGCDVPERA